MEENGFWGSRFFLLILIVSVLAVSTAPLILGVVNVTATVTGIAPKIHSIEICDGTCALNKTIDPATAFTLRVNIGDPNGQGDINTQSFRVTLFNYLDVNSCTEDWDCNAMKLTTDAIFLGSANGCTQNIDANIFCINLPATAWTAKFLWGDVNIYVAVDDNTGLYDSNAVDRNALTANKLLNRSEDTTSGTYSGAPSQANVAFNSTQTSKPYIVTQHTGNIGIDLNIVPSLFWKSATDYYIGEGNQSWDKNGIVANEVAFTAGQNVVKTDFNRGVYPTNSQQYIWFWLDIPTGQPSGNYDGNMTYGTKISANSKYQ